MKNSQEKHKHKMFGGCFFCNDKSSHTTAPRELQNMNYDCQLLFRLWLYSFLVGLTCVCKKI